jgi:hypothetical protein
MTVDPVACPMLTDVLSGTIAHLGRGYGPL